jgi:type II secretory pathway pseudopilin PulG
MVVVTIVGILAVIGLVAFRGHIYSSKSVEALAMVQSIRAAQERWRAENMVYLNVSQSGAYYPVDPSTVPCRQQRAFHTGATDGDARAWQLLNPTVAGPVEFGYRTTAGSPNGAITSDARVTVPGLTWPTPTQHWYIIEAVNDIDDDGVLAYFLASSFTGEVYRQNEGE